MRRVLVLTMCMSYIEDEDNLEDEEEYKAHEGNEKDEGVDIALVILHLEGRTNFIRPAVQEILKRSPRWIYRVFFIILNEKC